MIILAIETSSKQASVAVCRDGAVLCEKKPDPSLTHSQTLLLSIDEALLAASIKLEEVDYIAISAGPGSFTGLRIGATTAKALGLALDKKVIPVPTLMAMAHMNRDFDGFVCPMIDARRNQVYTAMYEASADYGNGLISHLAMCALEINELIDTLEKTCEDDSKLLFVGDGALLHKEKVIERLGDRAAFLDGGDLCQNASSVASLAYTMVDSAVLADDFEPEYLRQSQAEREYVEISCLGKGIESKTLEGDKEGTVKESEDKDRDIKAIKTLEDEVFGENAWKLSQVESHFDNSCNGAMVAYRKGVPCGYTLFQKIAGEGEIFRVAVSPSFRRAGIARRLLGILQEDMATDKWMLEVRAGNKPAISLYETMGFEAERLRQDYYSNPVEDALMMTQVIRK